MKIFETESSGASTPDPFEDDDGDYGSDENYDPGEEYSSSYDCETDCFILPNKRARRGGGGGLIPTKKPRKCPLRERAGNSAHNINKTSSSKAHPVSQKRSNTRLRSSSASSCNDSYCSNSDSEADEDEIDCENVSNSEVTSSNLSETEKIGQQDDSEYDLANSSDSEIFPLAKRLKRPSDSTDSSPHKQDEVGSRSVDQRTSDNAASVSARRSPDANHDAAPLSPSLRRSPNENHDAAPLSPSARQSPDEDHDAAPLPPSARRSPNEDHDAAPLSPSARQSPDEDHDAAPLPPSARRSPNEDHDAAPLSPSARQSPDEDHDAAPLPPSARRSPNEDHDAAPLSPSARQSPDEDHDAAPLPPSACRSPNEDHDAAPLSPSARQTPDVDHGDGPQSPSVRRRLVDSPVPNPAQQPIQDNQGEGSRRDSVIDEGWETTTAPIPDLNFDTETVGPRFPIDEYSTVIDVFNRLFPPAIVDYIVECTNAYGRELCTKNRPKTRNSRSYTFREVDREELLKFLGLCLLSGHVATPQRRKLFTMSDPLYYHPIFVAVLSGRRFEQLLRCLCVAPRSAKKHEKVTAFIGFVTRNFRVCYKPEKELSLDESLLLFKGRLSYRQYIKSKRARYGIKFFELTSADGYVLNMMMYTGKMADTAVKGKKIQKVVLKLIRPYALKGHSLYMDNLYNSVELSQKLIDLKTHTTGTLRVNRKGNPKRLLSKKLKRGNHIWARKNRVYVSQWVDKRPVPMITTEYHPQMIETFNRRGHPRAKPQEVVEYNKYMSGVDRVDQMISYYSSPRKTIKWYKKVFFHLLDIAVWNSFYIFRRYCKNNDKSYEYLMFREELIRNLIKIGPEVNPISLIRTSKYSNRMGSMERIREAAPDYGNGGHWPEKIPVAIGSKKLTNYLKCRMCNKNNRRKETGIRCKGCQDKPALCALCFEDWHSQLNN
ncbi:hypothetical protein O0L34_g19441 [Tuta absoluta]|nr:hypothetical protein O0L34_g19441 [Tuta absoluta]